MLIYKKHSLILIYHSLTAGVSTEIIYEPGAVDLGHELQNNVVKVEQ